MTSPRCPPGKRTAQVPSSSASTSSSAKPDAASTGISSVALPSCLTRQTSNRMGDAVGGHHLELDLRSADESIVASTGATPSATWSSTPR